MSSITRPFGRLRAGVDRRRARCHSRAVLYRLARTALFALDPERAHALAIAALKAAPRGTPAAPGGPLKVEVAGLACPNPPG